MAREIENLMQQAGFAPGGQEQEPPKPEEPKQEEQVEQEVKEKVKDKKQEEKPDTKKAETEQVTEQATGEAEKTGEQEKPKIGEQDILTSINESLETKFSSLNDIKSLIESKNRIGEFESAIDKYKIQLQEKDQMIERLGNPYSVFSDESVLRTNEIIKNNTGISPTVAFQVATGNFERMTDDQVLVLSKKMQNPKLDIQSDDIILDKINDDYRLNDYEEEEELTEVQEKRLTSRKAQKKADADVAREELKALADIKTPEQKELDINLEKEREEKNKQFQPIAGEIIDKDLDKVIVGDKEKFEFVIDDTFKNWLKEDDKLTQFLVANYDPNDPNSRAKMVEAVKNLYKGNQYDRIVDTIAESVKTRMQEEFDKDVHNPKDKNNQEAPEATDVATKNKEAEEKLLQRVR
jgi:hypothetical protein